METMGPTQARIYVPHGILLLKFRIHGNNKGYCMSYKSNTLGNIHNRSNLEGNVTYMGEEESNRSFLDTWATFPNIYDIYDIYDTNDEDAMTFMTY